MAERSGDTAFSHPRRFKIDFDNIKSTKKPPMSFWTTSPNKSTLDGIESLSSSPSGGRVKMWLLGVGLALIPISYVVHCLRTGHARFWGRGHSHVDLYGSGAVALAVAYIAVGVFIHAHWFWGLHPRLVGLSPLLKVLAALVFLGGFGYACFRIIA